MQTCPSRKKYGALLEVTMALSFKRLGQAILHPLLRSPPLDASGMLLASMLANTPPDASASAISIIKPKCMKITKNNEHRAKVIENIIKMLEKSRPNA